MPSRLIACVGCKRQIDVRHAHPGDEIRCRCGVQQTVPAVFAPRASTVRCASCGGPSDAANSHCSWCGSAFSAEPTEIAERCPQCMGRNPNGASFCCHCGSELVAHAIVDLASDLGCPRCEGNLVARFLEDDQVLECRDCRGLWLNPEHFERLCAKAARESHGTTDRFVPEADRHPPAYLRCLVCGDFMIRKNFELRSGVLIDWCRNHGVWLDDGEVSRVLHFMRDRACYPRG